MDESPPDPAGQISPLPAVSERGRPRKRGSSDAGQAIRAGLRRQLDRLEANLEQDDDPETIHDLRVATRRVRAALSLWRGISDPRRLGRARRAVRRLGKSLGALREADVNVAQLRALAGGAGAEPAVCETAIAMELQRARRLRRKVRRDRSRFDMDSLRRDLEKEVFRPAAGPGLRRFAGTIVAAANHEIRELGQKALKSEETAAFHALRIRIKKCRYAVELLAPAFDRSIERRTLKSLKSLQDRLGGLQDLVVLRARISKLRKRAQGDALSALGAGFDSLLDHLSRRQRDEMALCRKSVETFLRRGLLGELSAGTG
jgi:CHAD domain-containing protein